MSNSVVITENKQIQPELTEEEVNIEEQVPAKTTAAPDLNNLSGDNLKLLFDLAEKIKKNPDYDPNAPVQVVEKEKVKVQVDFSNLTENDIYDMDALEARGFLSSDVLKADLKDSNYIARWVNKNPKRLGSMIARGFDYVVKGDLRNELDQAVALDSSGHFAYDDVVLMKIPKSIYFPALKKAQMDAEAVLSQVKSGDYGKSKATQYLQNATAGEFGQAVKDNKVNFYNPPVGA